MHHTTSRGSSHSCVHRASYSQPAAAARQLLACFGASSSENKSSYEYASTSKTKSVFLLQMVLSLSQTSNFLRGFAPYPTWGVGPQDPSFRKKIHASLRDERIFLATRCASGGTASGSSTSRTVAVHGVFASGSYVGLVPTTDDAQQQQR